MASRVYGYKHYVCGCIVSLHASGDRLGFVDECGEMRDLLGAMITDHRPRTKEVSAEWQAKLNAHFEGQE